MLSRLPIGVAGPSAGFVAVFAVVVFMLLLPGCGDESPTTVAEIPEDADVISLSRRLWYPASLPVDPQDEFSVLLDDQRMPIIWYNIEPSYGLHRRDLNPNLNDRENNLVATLDMEVNPGPNQPTGPNWTGILTGFRRPLDLSGRMYLEIWVNDFKPDPGDRSGVLYVEIGRIDENFFEPDINKWNDEDRDRDGFGACIDDSGLDETHNWLADCIRNFYPDDPSEGGNEATDDREGDDYVPQRIDGRFTKVNGTERNGYYDSEDLNRSGAMDRTNSYFRYAVDLASLPVLDIRDEYPGYDGFVEPPHTRDSWRWYRIELSDGTPSGDTGVPASDLSSVHHIRIWFRDVEDVVHDEDAVGRYRLQIAKLKFTGHTAP